MNGSQRSESKLSLEDLDWFYYYSMVDVQKRKKLLAKAAASVSVPAIKGSIPLDSFDIKIIQYKNALYKLNELNRLLNILVPVSYTHLDVYKRQGLDILGSLFILLG